MPKAFFAAMIASSVILAGCASMPSFSDDEYEVYSDFLRQNEWERARFEDIQIDPLVIIRETSVRRLLFDSPTPWKFVDWLRENMAALQQSTIVSFEQRNQEPAGLSGNKFSGLSVELISRKEEAELFDGGGGIVDGWKAFYREYPNAQGILWLSRVGVSTDGRQGLLYYGNQWDGHAGNGMMILLERTREKWTIVKRVRVWIS